MINKIKEFFKKNKKILENISLRAASITFYTITVISSLAIVVAFIINKFNDSFKLSIIYDLIEILGITFNGFLNQSLQRIESINIILIFSIIISSSSIINSYNHYCDSIYNNVRKRKSFQNLISSIFMFLMIIVMFLLLLVLLVYGNYFVNLIFNNSIIALIFQYIFEILVFYCIFIVMLVYFPPVKMKFKDVYKENFFLTLIIFLTIKVFILIFNILYRKYKIIGLIYVFTVVGYLIYFVHFIMCYCLYYIWKKEEDI